jgi:hypothetical protein
MKKVLFTVVLCCVAATTFAQLNVKFGVTAGLNVSNETLSAGSFSLSPDWKAGFQAGVIADLSLSPSLSIMPELVFSQKGCKSDVETVTVTETINYLTLPVNLAYKFDLGLAGTLFPFAGPYVGYALSGNYKEGSESVKINFGSDEDEYKALDFGLNFGLGYQFEKLLFRLQYNLGLSNIGNVIEGADYSVKNKNVAVSVGYFF